MTLINKLIALWLIVLPTICIAGGGEELIGQAGDHRVVIDFDPSTPVITIYKYVDGEITDTIATEKFPDECTILKSNRSIVCRPDGKTLLKGTTYSRTLDATPTCSGKRVEYRYTCVKGCKEISPLYFSIEPYEC